MWSVIEGDTTAHLDWLRSVILDLETNQQRHQDDGDATGIWKPGDIRVFISHLAAEKELAGKVSRQLSDIGMSGFVAHDTIEPSREWQDEIERALRTADVLVGLVHPGFAASCWAQQEVGWAVGRAIPVLMVRMGEDPKGFVAKLQAPSMYGKDARLTASAIAVWLSSDATFGSQVSARLMIEVRTARSYKDAERAALRIEQIDRLSEPLLDELADAFVNSDQLYPHHVGARVIERIFARHGRTLPRREDAK
jgi:hypothetical protein